MSDCEKEIDRLIATGEVTIERKMSAAEALALYPQSKDKILRAVHDQGHGEQR